MTGIALPSPYNLQSFCCFFNGPKSVIEWYKHLGEQILDQIFLKVRALSNRMKTQHRGSAFLSIIQNQNCENPPAEVTPPTGSGTTSCKRAWSSDEKRTGIFGTANCSRSCRTSSSYSKKISHLSMLARSKPMFPSLGHDGPCLKIWWRRSPENSNQVVASAFPLPFYFWQEPPWILHVLGLSLCSRATMLQTLAESNHIIWKEQNTACSIYLNLATRIAAMMIMMFHPDLA